MRRSVLALHAVVVAACLIAAAVADPPRAEKPTRTVTGVVKKFEVVNGKVRSVYIKDPREGDLLVLRSTVIGKELLQHVGATVKATGYVKRTARPDSDFEQVIDVLRYEVVPAKDARPDAEAETGEDD